MIGLGGIAQTILQKFDTAGENSLECVGVMVRQGRLPAAGDILAGRYRAVDRVADLLKLSPDIVVECAGQQALAQYGEEILAAGCDLVAVSAGAFADREFEARMRASVKRHRGRIMIPSGAIAGMDGLTAALGAELFEVVYRGRKPAKAWSGTPAETLLDLAALTKAETFFEGNARDAARDYPKNANVAATVALAGVGFEKTRVTLVADPHAEANVHELEFHGAFGRIRLEVAGKASPSNPKTSMLTALSLWQTLVNGGSAPITIS
ncbi:aspartate dehydrogenase [Pelagibius sp. CAU 1746]|uniref:aspartate dehydrogenase n=1 Tax=Pelagibius sp. CAU 1746 TaxID=3140370 RepID=UPI00325BEFC7